MNFANPIAFIGLLAMPAIIAMYLFKQQYNETPIGSLFLWREIVDEAPASRRWQKLRANLLMFLQIVAALFAVLALSGPYVPNASETRDYILVLDVSMSMQAVEGSGMRLDAAKAEALKVVGNMGAGETASLLVLNYAPYLAVNATGDKRALTGAINGLEPTYATADWETAAALLESLYAEAGYGIYLFSDRDYDAIMPMNRVIVGMDAANAAITSFSCMDDGSRTVALAKVRNYSGEARGTSVAVYADGEIADVRDIELEAGEEQDVFFLSLPAGAGTLTARLTGEDALGADDTAYAVMSEEGVHKALLLTEGNVFLESILSLMTDIELYHGNAAAMEGLSGYSVYIFDGVLPESLPTDGHLLVFNPPEGNTFIETGAERAVRGVSPAEHSLLDYTGGMDMAISIAKTVTRPAWAQTVLADGEYPLIITGTVGAQRAVVCAFDLHNTDLPLLGDFPIFMYNIFGWFMPGGTVADGVAGETAVINLLPDVLSARVVKPGGGIVSLAPPFPAPGMADTGEAGIYLLENNTQYGTDYTRFAMNPDTSESDISMALKNGYYTAGGDTEGRVANLDLSGFCLIALLIALILEWWVYSHEF